MIEKWKTKDRICLISMIYIILSFYDPGMVIYLSLMTHLLYMSAVKIYFIIIKLLTVDLFIVTNYFMGSEPMEAGKVKYKKAF